MAVSLVGDAGKVRDTMECSDADFRAFGDGTLQPDATQRDRLLALIVREQGLVIARSRELVDELRRRKYQWPSGHTVDG